ncbi:hypothetical protein LXT23_19925 [Pyxidicoccus sp. QH1ED-7-1]|nr:hypothetical protein [Pyxidicoccus xibeiensis]MCP3139591.1 hypothetical protein [Pyxidicoccus xibeiensis]
MPYLPAALLFGGVLGVPVQEGEAEELRLAQRSLGQQVPEGEEALPETSGAAIPELEFEARETAYLALGEVAHRQGEAALVAIVAVQGAHRHTGNPRQLLGPDILVAPPRQQPRRRHHRRAVEVLPNPHAPPLPPAGWPPE